MTGNFYFGKERNIDVFFGKERDIDVLFGKSEIHGSFGIDSLARKYGINLDDILYLIQTDAGLSAIKIISGTASPLLIGADSGVFAVLYGSCSSDIVISCGGDVSGTVYGGFSSAVTINSDIGLSGTSYDGSDSDIIIGSNLGLSEVSGSSFSSAVAVSEDAELSKTSFIGLSSFTGIEQAGVLAEVNTVDSDGESELGITISSGLTKYRYRLLSEMEDYSLDHYGKMTLEEVIFIEIE